MVEGNITPDFEFIDIGADVSGAVSGALQLPVDPSGVIRTASSFDVIGQLPPDVARLGRGAVQAIGSVADEVAGAMPAIDLIAGIASGRPPTDPQAIVGAMAATAALVNPVAGAIMGAMGEAVLGINDLGEQVFKSLGLISNYASQRAYDYFGFVRKGDPIPWGPTHPAWKTWDYWMTPVDQGWRWGTLPIAGDAYYRQLPFTNIIESLGRYPRGLQGLGGPFTGPIGQNDFETYFFTVLKPDLENWMNANPAIPPRDLLRAAAALWNHQHPDPRIGTRTYSPLNVTLSGRTPGRANNPIEVIMSSVGDTSDAGLAGAGQDMPPITVNVAPRVTPARPLSIGEAFSKIQQQIASAMPSAAPAAPKKVISLQGIPAPAAPKKTFDLRAASRAVVAQQKASPVVEEKSLLQQMLPYAPIAAGIVLTPVGGFLAPVVGLAASALWLWRKKS